MIPVVRDDGWWRPARRASWQVSRGWWWASMLVAVIALPPRPSAGQDFQVSVRDLTQRAMHVAVPLFGSVTVDSTVPITRANVIASDIADVQVISPTRLLITGQGYGTTNVVLFGGDDRQSLIEVSVELDLSRLNEAITEIDPRSTARAHSVLGNIILTGTVSGTDRADRIVELADLFLPPNATAGREPEVQNHLEVAGEHQVLLRCVVAEVSRRAVRELGVNGFVAGDDFSDMFLVNQIGGVNPINIGAAGDVLANATIPFVTGSGGIPLQPSATLSLGFPRVQLQTFIKALADNALLKVLAEPNLVAISGETATFLAGGEFPIPVPQGNQTVTIEFREFGVRLNFTPVVRGGQRIRLRVAPEVSELDLTNAAQFQGFVIPGLTSRSTETTVELGNGETIAVAGLLSEQINALASRVPGIGDVPILGALFRSVSFRRSLSELVILVTPEIVAPLDASQAFGLPTDRVHEPTDHELYMLGLVEGSGGLNQPTAADNATASVDAFDGLVKADPDELSLHGPWGHADPVDGERVEQR